MKYNPHIVGLTGTPISSATSALLWIMSPRIFSPQVRRPLMYQFNPQFIHQAEVAVSQKAEQRTSHGIRSLLSAPEMMHHTMFPDAQGAYSIDLHKMQRSWTFLLVVNNDPGDGGPRRLRVDSQQLYYGFFVDEPFNPVFHGVEPSYNLNAVMMITHKTIINKNNIVGGGYGTQARYDLMADLDVIHPRAMTQLSSTATTLMRPRDLYVITNDEQSNANSIVMHSEDMLLTRQEEPLVVGSKFSVPRHHMDHVLHAVAEARSTMQSASAAGEIGRSSLNFGRDDMRSLIEDNLADKSVLNEIGIRANTALTLGAVQARYNPIINRAMQDALPTYDPIGQSTISPRNVFSSLLTTVMPALMAEYKLLEIAFRYDSPTQAFEVLETLPPASLISLSQTEVQGQVRGFFFRLSSEIFPILTMNHGEFFLNMQCANAGVTHVNLNFYDDAIRSPEVFEVPTIYGGMNSAMLGSPSTVNNNAGELHSLIRHMTVMDTDRAPLNFYDERGLQQLPAVQPTFPGLTPPISDPFANRMDPSNPYGI